MSSTNLIWLEGRMTDWREMHVRFGDYQGYAVVGTLVSDSAAYGGRHAVIFPEGLGRALLPHVAARCGETCALSLGGTLQSHGARQSVRVREFTCHTAAVADALQALTQALFARPGMPAAHTVPAAFWETPLGRMAGTAYIWLEHDDLITMKEAAGLAGLSLTAIASRVERGQLTAYPYIRARNPRSAGRLVRRSEVLALAAKN